MEYKNIIQSTLDEIDKRIKDNIHVDELARAANYSTFHFRRVFVEMTGTPFMIYITRRKLEYAFYEMSQGKRVIDAAMDYGFETHAGFTKAFKKYYGYPPSSISLHNTASPPIKATVHNVKLRYGGFNMKIYFTNGYQGPLSESIRKNVSLVGSVVLKAIKVYGIIQLLEGSHRMGHAIELGLPVTIILYDDDEVIFHDCDDIESPTTGLHDYATAGELARALVVERGLLMYKVPVFESDDLSNVKIVKPEGETGHMLYSRLTKDSPFTAFPRKIWEVIFGELGDVIGKNVLVLNNKNAADSFKRLGADVTLYQGYKFDEVNNSKFDLIYATDILNEANLIELFTAYKKHLTAKGLAVTLNENQTVEIISSAGLDVYGFLKTREEKQTASFVKLLDE